MTVGTRWFSLRRHLLVLLLGGVSLGWLASMALSYLDAHHEIDELFDAQLVQSAQTLLAMASEYDGDDDVAELDADGHKYQRKIVFQMWDDEGHMLLRSRQAPTTPLSTVVGFSDETRADGHDWRYYSQWDKERHLRVLVGQVHAAREELARHIARRLLAPALLGLPLLGLWLWFATRRGLAPIAVVTAAVAQRAPERLDPLVPATAPLELRPLVEALNALFGRVAATLQREREFTANAAHELRTPLAALAAQAEVAMRARDAAERDHALGQIGISVARASRLVEQLLTLARLDPAASLGQTDVRLDLLATEVCADHGPAALDKNIALELDAPLPVTLTGQPELMRILLRNLVDNAVRYTPAGGQVGVAVHATADTVVVSVHDSGPGIPPAERTRVLERFQRLAGQEVAGSGLGLSIVARIAELHGARLELGAARDGTGLSVTLAFPARLPA